jgi:hypothetical protein
MLVLAGPFPEEERGEEFLGSAMELENLVKELASLGSAMEAEMWSLHHSILELQNLQR